jgi:type III secretion protein J
MPAPKRLRWWIALLSLALLSACRTELHAKLTERDANEILAALYAAGISAAKDTRDQKTWTVEVEKKDLQRAIYVMLTQGLPREQFASTGDIFKKDGLISTPWEDRIRYIYATSQELSNTLSQIDGVVSARVHPVIPANDPLATHPRPSSASVFIKHRRDADLSALAPAIRNLVTRGIEGLAYENIALTFVAADEANLDTATVQHAALAAGNLDIVTLSLGALLLVMSSALVWCVHRLRILTGAEPIRWKEGLDRAAQWSKAQAKRVMPVRQRARPI